MTSFLIISTDKAEREKHALHLAKEHGIDAYDISILDKEHKGDKKKTTLSLGIEDVKNMQSKLYLKPFKSPAKCVIIHDAQLLTNEAQNAMLKILEEPPQQTFIFLTAESTYTILPTILSRCKIVHILSKKIIPSEEKEIFTQILQSLDQLTIFEALSLADGAGKNKESAINWLEKIIIIAREQMLTSLYPFHREIVKNLQSTHHLLKTTNTNPRMAIEMMLIKLVQL